MSRKKYWYEALFPDRRLSDSDVPIVRYFFADGGRIYEHEKGFDYTRWLLNPEWDEIEKEAQSVD